MIRVLTWLWSQPDGRSRYTAQHVNIWAAMVRRNLTMPHTIACVTDMPEGIDRHVEIIEPPRDFEDWRIPTWGKDKPQCLRRIAMFAPDAAKTFGERFVCMDLDVVIHGALDPMFETDATFKIAVGTGRGRPYNGSMMLITAGARPQVYERFTPEAAAEAGQRFIGSDQAWISHCLPGEATWGQPDGLEYWTSWRRNPKRSRLTFFPGAMKPWEVQDPFMRSHYRGFREGRCLILGHGPTVWDEAAEAIKAGPIAGVVASPEAAAHFPGAVMATALTDDKLERVARMLGFDEIVFCGREPVMEAA